MFERSKRKHNKETIPRHLVQFPKGTRPDQPRRPISTQRCRIEGRGQPATENYLFLLDINVLRRAEPLELMGLGMGSGQFSLEFFVILEACVTAQRAYGSLDPFVMDPQCGEVIREGTKMILV